MKILLSGLFFLFVLGLISTAQAAQPDVTLLPEGVVVAPPDNGVWDEPCDVLIRYDDNEDDWPGSGYTLGGETYPPQLLGFIGTIPKDQDYYVQSGFFWSEFWVTPGMVPFYVAELRNPSNNTVASIYVTGPGVWSVSFSPQIRIPAGRDFFLMLCPGTPTCGVTGEDLDAPLYDRSYWSTGEDCYPRNPIRINLMIWACVTPVATATKDLSWGTIRSLYR